GIIICTVGAPGLIMTPILNVLIASHGFSQSLQMVAAFYAIICFGLGWIVVSPTEKDLAHFTPTNVTAADSVNAQPMFKQYTTSEALKTKQYYLVTAAMMLAVPAYFLINPMMLSLGVERGLSSALAVTGVMISSILNISGRLFAPWVSDKLGRKPMLILLFTISMASVLTLIIAEGYLFILCVALVSFSYGGFFGIFPVIVVDYFGAQYSGMNYGMVMIGYGVVSIFCPTIVSMGIGISFVVAGIACVLGMICTVLLRHPSEA
ncbi:MAG: MFS transporter, partial [Eubacteriales bacterium]